MCNTLMCHIIIIIINIIIIIIIIIMLFINTISSYFEENVFFA